MQSECEICHKSLNQNINFNNLFKLKVMYLCEQCESMLERVNKGCRMCGKKTKASICEDCLYWEAHSLNIKNYSLYHYNELGKEIINQVKFSGNCKVLNVFYDEVRHFFFNKIKSDYYTVPVPLSKDRLNERGFNQSLSIAKMLPFKILDVLIKTNNDQQSKKSRHDRLNSQNFELKESSFIKNKKLIIVDDIYTTGSTIHQIGKLLLTKNPLEVISFTLFRS